MHYEKIGGETIKITLTTEDMLAIGFDIDEIDSFEGRIFLCSLMCSAEENCGIRFDAEQLICEVIELEYGCVIYISPAMDIDDEVPENDTESYVFEFENTDNLLAFAKLLPPAAKSTLYILNKKYRLVLPDAEKDRRYEVLADEFEVNILSSKLSVAETAEHWDIVIDKNAIEMLKEL